MLGWLRDMPSSTSLFKYFLFKLTTDSLQGNGEAQGDGESHRTALGPRGHLLEGLAVVDDGDHVLHIAGGVLPVSQVLLLV